MKLIFTWMRRIVTYFKKKWISYLGSLKYQRFVIISRSRTGSTFLIQLLNSHPKVNAQGEVFLHLKGRKTIDIWDQLFCKKHRHIKYVGFKLFYYHPVDSDDKSVWDIIKKDTSIKIIHLTRKNMLRTIVSRKIAEKTSQWHVKANSHSFNAKEKRVEISAQECFDEFQRIKEWEKETRVNFSKHSVFELSYEELEADSRNAIHSVFTFLNLKAVQVKSSVKKQNKEDLSELIINYDELTASLKNSEWAYLLNNN